MALKMNTRTQGISVKDLSFAYPGGGKVLDGVSFDIAPGSRVLLAGSTGSGKSTLLRCLKPELTPSGELSGNIQIAGQSVQELNAQVSAGRIGFVMQDPRQQIVMDTVKAELAFGLENLGTPPEMIQRRVAEIANYFGINSWVERGTSELSGGETQLVNLASVIAMQPRALLLDEPTAMLDPIAAREFMELVERVNDELGITVILVEHKQEDLLNTMNQVLYLEEGHLAFDGRTREFAQWLHGSGNSNRRALPVATQLYLKQPEQSHTVSEEIPLDVREGRWWLWQHKDEALELLGISDQTTAMTQQKKQSSSQAESSAQPTTPHSTVRPSSALALEARHIWYRYSKTGSYILKDLSLGVERGSILGIVGANASGKSTLLSLLFGTFKPQHGKVLQASDLQFGLLPQDPTTLFIRDTLTEDLMDHAQDFRYAETEVQHMLDTMGLLDKKERHPFDLSGGEQQKLAMAKLLLTNPDVLLLDEPTKGLDSLALSELYGILTREAASGKTIIMVSHDLEFVAATADECLMLFDGEPVGRASASEFFAGNMFYTTALQRITQGILENCPPVLGWRPNSLQPKSGGSPQ